MYADRKAPYPETITAPLISLRSRCHWSRFPLPAGALRPDLARHDVYRGVSFLARKLRRSARRLSLSLSLSNISLPPREYFSRVREIGAHDPSIVSFFFISFLPPSFSSLFSLSAFSFCRLFPEEIGSGGDGGGKGDRKRPMASFSRRISSG
jgi:hypothetical protein